MNTGRYAVASFGITTAALFTGGNDGPPTPDDTGATEIFNGTAWTEVNDMNSVKQYCGGAGTITDGIAFGTNNAPTSTNTEEWDGTSWTEVANLATGRNSFTGAAGSGSLAFAAGGNPGNVTATEEWTKALATVSFDTD
tara:strand:- start:138 stop:554 length:417 start_codon:yes stop_codon:yes gene_type:complete